MIRAERNEYLAKIRYLREKLGIKNLKLSRPSAKQLVEIYENLKTLEKEKEKKKDNDDLETILIDEAPLQNQYNNKSSPLFYSEKEQKSLISKKALEKINEKGGKPGIYRVMWSIKAFSTRRNAYITKQASETFNTSTGQSLANFIIKISYEVVENYEASVVHLEQIQKVEILPINDNTRLENIPLRRTLLQYKAFPEFYDGEIYITNQCVLNAMLEQLSKYYKKKYTRLSLKQELIGDRDIEDGITLDDVILWQSQKNPRCSITVYDAFGKLYKTISSSHTNRIPLTFLINNGHMVAIKEIDNIHKPKKLWKSVIDVSDINPKNHYLWCFKSDNSDLKSDKITDEMLDENIKKLAELPEEVKYILIDHPDNCLGFLVQYLTLKYKRMITNFNTKKSAITSFAFDFIQPLNERTFTFCIAPEYKERKHIIDTLNNLYPNHGITFSNQTYGAIAETMQRMLSHSFQNSVYGPQLFDIIHSGNVKPIIGKTVSDEEYKTLQRETNILNQNIYDFDYNKLYSSVLMNSDYDFPVYSLWDEIKPFNSLFKNDNIDLEVGEYYVNVPIHLKGFDIPAGWYPHNFVSYCIRQKLIKLKNITHCLQASLSLRKDFFKELTDFSFKEFPQTAKHICNHYIGVLGKKQITETYGAITNDWKTVVAHQNHEVELGRNFSVYNYSFRCFQNRPVGFEDDGEDEEEEYEDADGYFVNSKSEKTEKLYFMKSEKIQKMSSGNTPIWRQIVAESWIKLDIMAREVSTNESKILSFNTDSIKVYNPKYKWINVNKSDVGIGCFGRELTKDIRGNLLPVFKDDIEELQIEENDNITIVDKKGAFFTGMAGSGKSYTLARHWDATPLYNKINNEKRKAMLTFTNPAREVCKSKVKIDHDEIFTLDSFFGMHCDRRKQIEKLIKLDEVFVDETSMVPPYYFELFAQAKKQKPDLVFWLAGEAIQCSPINSYWKYYEQKYLVRWLVGFNIVRLEYIKEASRFTPELKILIDELLETKTLPLRFCDLTLHEEPNANIVVSWDLRDKLNKEYYKKHDGEKVKIYKSDISKSDKSDLENKTRSLKKGIKLILYTNFKEYELYNSDIVVFKNIDDKYALIEKNGVDIQIPKKLLLKKVALNAEKKIWAFEINGADTIRRQQGKQLTKYNIHEINKMSLNMIYVALTRATKLEDIGLDGSLFPKKEVIEPGKPTENKLQKIITFEREPEPVPKFKEGYVYMLFNDTQYYIGMTTQTLKKRIKQHLQNPTSEQMETFLSSEFQHCILERVLYADEGFLASRERALIQSIQLENKEQLNGTLTVSEVATSDFEKKPRPKYKTCNASRFVKKINILETENTFRIKWTPLKIDKRFSYGERCKYKTREEALEKVEEYKKELENKINLII